MRQASILPLARSICAACATVISRLPLRRMASITVADISCASAKLNSVLPASTRRLRGGITTTVFSLRYKVCKLMPISSALVCKYSALLPWPRVAA